MNLFIALVSLPHTYFPLQLLHKKKENKKGSTAAEKNE